MSFKNGQQFTIDCPKTDSAINTGSNDQTGATRKSEILVKRAFLGRGSRGSRGSEEKTLVFFMTVIALNTLISFSSPASPASPAPPAHKIALLPKCI
ncbi:hypothetical protein CDG76_21200 [Nostoc sp. 'Peltigera membranacea cyanobiont' 210A]|nr:hypothetical protein CDG76_21200 [Nostoc sp. 'Peltigera membranacea cyanobiont' 210A]